MARRDPSKGLGRTQVLCLRLLASRGSATAGELEYHWPSLTEASARAACMRLGMRGLVDLAPPRPNHPQMTFTLTDKGRRVESATLSEVRCSSCDGPCLWTDDAWVCFDCGDEWYPDHNPRFAPPED